MNIEEIKNILREFQAQNGLKFKNTQGIKSKLFTDANLSMTQKKIFTPI